jgi:hypothetical protein
MKMAILRRTLVIWLERKLWRHVLFLCTAGVLLAGVSLFKGWLHQQVGFDGEGKPLNPEANKVEAGTASSSKSKLRHLVTDLAAYRMIAEDLQRRDNESRPRLRYLTLWHRHNEPSYTDADLEANRRAIPDVMAIVSNAQSSRFDFIDPDQLIFRLDLEDLNWSADTDWRRVVSSYRYGIASEGDGTLAKLRHDVQEFTQDSIPVVRADWFVVALTRPPLAGSNGLVRVAMDQLSESVRTLNRQYVAETLDVAVCTRELGLNDPKALAGLIQREPNLQQEFGLAPLLLGDRIRREWWESDRNFFSPYQELARLLKVGKPVRVQ